MKSSVKQGLLMVVNIEAIEGYKLEAIVSKEFCIKNITKFCLKFILQNSDFITELINEYFIG